MPDQQQPHKDSSIASYLSKAGSSFADALVKRFSSPKSERRNRFILLFATALLLTLILVPDAPYTGIDYKTGDVAQSDVRVSRDYMIEDRAMTEQRRKEAGNNAPVVYNLSKRIPPYLSGKFEQAVTAARQARSDGHGTPQELVKVLAPILDTEVSAVEAQAFARIRNDRKIISDMSALLERTYSQHIVLDLNVIKTDLKRGMELQDDDGKILGPASPDLQPVDISDIRTLIKSHRIGGTGDSADSSIFTTLLSRIILPNLYYNREASQLKAKTAEEMIRPILFKIRKGEMIIRMGDRINPEQAHKLSMIVREQDDKSGLMHHVGVFCLILVLLYFPFRFACKNIRKFNPSNKDILILSLFLTISFLVFRTGIQITGALGPVFPKIDTGFYFYLFPFAAGAMLIRIFLNSEVALVYSAITAPLVGIMFGNNMQVAVYALMASIVGAHGVRQCTNRGTIYSAGMKVAVVNLAVGTAFQIFSGNLFTYQTVYVACFALVGGLTGALVVSGIIPVVEALFHYTTDIKLLELANLNAPLLKDLMLKSPGTYHHSVVVGNLVEAAAEAINANPLLARVAAYYHDIGKASKPQYFIENQTSEENRHDKLTPSMSALILISHVKEGAELAREKHLGQPIIDIIRQHHGTALIKFFYDRAKTMAGESGHLIDEMDFRYPGPKPQTREAGIVMLADCVEAASRTLVNPTPDRIQGMVQKLINNVFIDGQLDECELTLKNLHEIARSFNKILNGIFHHRIDYPEPVHKGGNGGRKGGDSPEKQPEKASNTDETHKRHGTDDIKRLGM